MTTSSASASSGGARAGASMSTTRILTRTDSAPAGPEAARAGQAPDVLYRLTLRLDGYANRYPEALALLADVVAVLHAELDGSASALCGTYSERNWRDVTLGERDLSVKDLCRLAKSAHPKARAAVARIVTLLAAAARQDTVRAPEPLRAVADLARTGGALQAEIAEDMSDGRLDRSEALDLLPEIEAQERALEGTKALVADALSGAPVARQIRLSLAAAREART
jgi:hypothetical protein